MTGRAYGQSYELTCPTGSTPSNNPNGLAFDPSTGKYRQWLCYNPGTGQFTFNDAIVGTGTGTGSAGQSAYFSATNAISGGTVVLDMKGISGADLGAIMNTCASSLPAGGGICSGLNLTSPLTWSTAVTTAKPVFYVFCGQSISQSGAFSAPNPNSGITGCPAQSTTITKAANIDQITISGTHTYVGFLTLVGVGGSFTGNGIVQTTAQSTLSEYNNISGEAGAGISAGPGTAQFNNVSSTSAGHAITFAAGSAIIHNVVTTSASDGIYTNSAATGVNVTFNIVTLSPNASTSGLCAINFNSDQLNDLEGWNTIAINDSTNTGNNDYAVCDTPSGGHNFGMLFQGDQINATVSGTVQPYGFFLNNAAGVNTNWSVIVRDMRCVHMFGGACIKRTDAQNNATVYEDIQPEDTPLDAGTGSTADIWIQRASTFATLPSPVGNGSQIYCTNCTQTTPALTGGPGAFIVRTNGQWNGLRVSAYAYGQTSAFCTASAASCTTTFANHTVPGDTIIVSADCAEVASPTITVADTGNANTYTAIPGTLKQNPGATFWNQLFLAPATVPPGTITISGTGCTLTEGYAVSYRTLLPVAPTDVIATPTNGTSASASITITGTNGDMTFLTVDNHGQCNSTGVPSGFTARAAGVQTVSIADNTMPITGTLSPAWSCTNADWITNAVTFKINQP